MARWIEMCHGIDRWIADHERERLERAELDDEDLGGETTAEGTDEPLAPAADD